jgi:hypothetical protein
MSNLQKPKGKRHSITRVLLNPPREVWCRVSTPLYWHKIKISHVYIMDGKTLFVICPKHNEEVYLEE